MTDLHSRFTEAKESIKGKRLQLDSHAPSHSHAGKKLGVVKPKKVVRVIDARSKAKPVPRHAPAPSKTQVESKFSPEMSEE